MNVNYPSLAIMENQIPDLLARIAFARELGIAAHVKIELLDLYDEVERELASLKSKIESNGFLTEYTNQLSKDLDHPGARVSLVPLHFKRPLVKKFWKHELING